MALIRGHHSFDDHFTQIPNDWLRDPQLSLGAIGLLAQLLSHAPGWRISIDSLAKANGCGRTIIKKYVDELLAAKYLDRSEKQEHDSRGFLIGFTYTTRDPKGNEPQAVLPCKVAPTKATQQHKNTSIKNNNLKEDITQKAKRSKSAPFALPDGWQPKPETRDKFGTKWVKIEYESTLEAFIEFSLAKGSKWVDWDLAFQSWCRKAEGWAKPGPSKPLTREEQALAEQNRNFLR